MSLFSYDELVQKVEDKSKRNAYIMDSFTLLKCFKEPQSHCYNKGSDRFSCNTFTDIVITALEFGF